MSKIDICPVCEGGVDFCNTLGCGRGKVQVGSIVESIDSKRNPLRSGAEWYPYAIVVQVEPLILVSEEADMRWRLRTVNDVRVIGHAPAKVLVKCMNRLKD